MATGCFISFFKSQKKSYIHYVKKTDNLKKDFELYLFFQQFKTAQTIY
jgi:hypothetical protein